jgi:probable rRNA maturation factor
MLVINVYNSTNRMGIQRTKLKRTVESVFHGEKIKHAQVNIILTDDAAIHDMNKQYLNHDYPTDVITFSLNEGEVEKMPIDAEIYISVETAAVQANDYGVSLLIELMRLAAHGALHLAGYDDETDEGRAKMHDLETCHIMLARHKPDSPKAERTKRRVAIHGTKAFDPFNHARKNR